MSDLLQVTTTTGTRDVAERIAVELVDLRLAACVQVERADPSTYRWQGKVENAEEWLCTAKTSREQLPAIQEVVEAVAPVRSAGAHRDADRRWERGVSEVAGGSTDTEPERPDTYQYVWSIYIANADDGAGRAVPIELATPLGSSRCSSRGTTSRRRRTCWRSASSTTAASAQAAMLRWGLIPSWAKELQGGGPPMINARGETLAEKPSFRTAMRRRRCLIPADGFYEWQKSVDGAAKKQPYYIHYRDDRPFAFAGLWESWAAPKSAPPPGGPTIESCTIVTTSASEALASLHDRMPVILAPGDYELWLDPAVEEPAAVAHLLAPCDDEELIAEPVSTHVNRVANDDPQCIEVQRALFD